MFNLNLSHHDHQLKSDELYDLLIVGSGPAGISAALYAARKGLKVGIIGDKVGGQVNDTSSVENYMGFEFITGEDLAHTFEKHLPALKIDHVSDAKIKTIIKGEHFELAADNYMTYRSKTVLVATGAKSRELQVPGEKAFYGKGVTYCGICDGPLFKDKTIVVVGGGNSAVEAALDLSKIAKQVHLIHRSNLKADQILIDKLVLLNHVQIHLSTRVTEIKGDAMVNEIEVVGDLNGSIPTDGLLIEIGTVPNSQFLEGVALNDKHEIIVDQHHMSNIEGLFAAGDVTTEKYKQIIVAAGEGAKAALSINEYLNNL